MPGFRASSDVSQPTGLPSSAKTAADHESLSERMYPIWKRLLEYDQGMHPEDLEESEKQWKPYFDSAEAKLRS